MLKYPQALENLIEAFQSLPSVGRKTAERYALYILNHQEEENIIDFSNALLSLKKDIHTCMVCGNMTEGTICPVCMDTTRNKKQIIVVEDVKDLYTLENLTIFKGVYHVLNGAISFSKGVAIEDLNIDSLIERIKTNEVEEIIIATNITAQPSASFFDSTSPKRAPPRAANTDSKLIAIDATVGFSHCC
jgi:recombination protein RecR